MTRHKQLQLKLSASQLHSINILAAWANLWRPCRWGCPCSVSSMIEAPKAPRDGVWGGGFPSPDPTSPRVDTVGTTSSTGPLDISRSALCCHSNETRAPTANPPNSGQLGFTPYHSSKLHPGPCSSVGMWLGTDRHTRVTNIHFASSTTHAKCDKTEWLTKVVCQVYYRRF